LPEIGVLLVEDERFLDRVVSDALRTIGVPCETVSSEEEAVRRLEQRRYDLLILDLRILRGSGVAVLQQARALYPDLPVIVVTAYTAAEDVMHALALGVDALLYKPFDIDTLLNTVRTLLRQRTPAETASAAAQMRSEASGGLRWLEVGALAALRSETLTVLGRVQHADELFLSVNTEILEPPYPARWKVEWTGSDALYQFETRVVEASVQVQEMLWILRLPRLIRRLQRRRYPRLPGSWARRSCRWRDDYNAPRRRRLSISARVACASCLPSRRCAAQRSTLKHGHSAKRDASSSSFRAKAQCVLSSRSRTRECRATESACNSKSHPEQSFSSSVSGSASDLCTRNSHRQPVFVRYFINPRNFTKKKASGSADNPP
jgi:DNA-binding response OmpR family regulator